MNAVTFTNLGQRANGSLKGAQNLSVHQRRFRQCIGLNRLRQWKSLGCRSGRTLGVQSVNRAGTTTVKIITQGRHMQVTDAIKQYVEEKVSKAVGPFEDQVREVDVTMSVRGGDTPTKGSKQQQTQVTVYTTRNAVVRVQDVEDNLYASIDLVCDKVHRKLQKIKEKIKNRGKGKISVVEYLPEDDVVEKLPFDKEVKLPAVHEVKTQYSYLTKSMDKQEAIEQLKQNGQNFYLFVDKESMQIAVAHKQENGYAVIVPLVDEDLQ
eukprot:TRINITY_DN17163_c0_g1_i1.p1 TRINITY_DN17163_c0_g1~~TRINITY_DN17163_c0_g1_i1.p1  ORF type:complete len:265 (+),score=45.81 TRINITY_DN17163_c0_g1_i1:125-919(+)